MSRSLGFLVVLCVTVFAAVFGYHAFERAARVSRSEAAIVAHADEVFRSETSVVAGNPKGDVSIVAFYDYNCPYCRKDAPELDKLVAKDGKVRLVLKELPVLGPDSEDAARIVLATEKQGRSFELYRRLIGAQGRVNKARALAVAGDLGLDTARLERDMNDPEVTATLLANTRLADALGVRGVPFYLVGDQVVSEGEGYFYDALKNQIADIRENGCRATC